MGIVQKKGLSAEETAKIVNTTAVARGKDQAQVAIVRILGGRKAFVAVRIGLTDVDLGSKPVGKTGYTVHGLVVAGSPSVLEQVRVAVAEWLTACHGKRFEASGEPPVKPGTKWLYVAVR